MELRRAGFSEVEIRARQNELRQNSAATTAKALKEHFILERIAEEEKIDAEEGDFEQEIFLMAMQSGESPRRVRAQIEKRGLMDILQNQIVERKVLERVQSEAKFKDKPYEPGKIDGRSDLGRRRRRRRGRCPPPPKRKSRRRTKRRMSIPSLEGRGTGRDSCSRSASMVGGARNRLARPLPYR